MIFQGLFNILDLYFKDIDLFYNNIDHYFREKINNVFENSPIQKEELSQKLEELISYLKEELINLGFEQIEIETKFLDPYLEIQKDDMDNIVLPLEVYEKKVASVIYEIFLEKIVDYLVDPHVAPLMLKLKDEGFPPIEFIVELRNLKTLLERSPEKLENLKKYVRIRENIINKFRENRTKIESLEDIKEAHYKLQLVYLVYRIIHFFNLQNMFDFSHVKSFLKNNVDEWLMDVPLVSLKNPDIYFCGIYLAKNLDVKLDKEKIKNFLLNLLDEAGDRYESPIIEATDGAYYFFKSTELMKLWLKFDQINKIIKTNPKFFESSYLKNLETSQLVVILKLYHQLGVSKLENEIRATIEELGSRVTSEGVKQFRDGFVSSEATYYVIFCNYMNNTLDKLKEYDILSKIVSRIYRNLELLDFSIDTNYDLLSELFYSCESLKLFNCIETKEMIIHLAKYLFPQEIIETITSSKEIIRTKARFRHLKVNRFTGDTVY